MSTAKTALIIGASRGLGLGLVKTLLADGWQVTATVRNPQNADALQALGKVRIEKLDMDDQQAVIALSQRLKDEVFDLLFVNAGVKGPDVQTPGGATLAEVGQLFFTNAVAPINLAQRFVGQIRPDTGVLAFMSSVLGSVTMPDAPELALYKASKAALNSMTNSFVTQLNEQSGEQKLTVLSLHPGWVKTDMGGEGADIDVDTSTRGLVDQVNAYVGKGGHHFVNYRGETIPW
ncbi:MULTISPECIES: SDR family oxidoreductase [Pseudomonas]|uniref:SDR family oxidoreductase n=1 Tax=Pseudomonas izuensis TaxID=2684212 RepID=A0ABM7RKW7_9PSED|nr:MULTISPECIES: SDR family oxidoreductase [Pseudomonas]RKS21176.1 short-subunit dehydrogenase [Pseudomonas sp. WPR_5_2]BCX66028.1 SDR family oxidoreductase [Pseudomonas izuensis]